jgi:hypothetical protein
MLFRRLCKELPNDDQRRHRARLGLAFLVAGMVLNTLASLTGRIDLVGDFFVGMMTGMALVFLLASLPLALRGAAGRR